MRYNIGLDIGVTSVGWAVINLDRERIERLGVRMFEVAENPKDGSSLAAPRREARSSRRRLRRRKYRIARVRKFIVDQGLLTKGEATQLFDWQDGDLDIWLVRVNALERKLTEREFARILIHCAKYRGFKSNRKSESEKEENGVVLSAVKDNHEKMTEKGYLTIAQLLVHEAELFDGRKRNRSGQYTHVFARSDLENEIKVIFAKQREFKNPFATKANEEKYLQIWSSQRPFASKEAIVDKIGQCSIIPSEKRAPKFTYHFERFRALDKLNRLRILSKDKPSRKLTDDERDIALNYLMNEGKKEIKYTDLRKVFTLDEEERFNEIYYDEAKSFKENEKMTFIALEGQYKIKKVIKDVEGKSALYEYRPIDFDTIAYALTVYKDDQDIKDYLRNEYVDSKGNKTQNLANRIYNDPLIEGLLSLSFSKFSHLSLKALKNLLVHMEKGHTYIEACQLSGYTLKRMNQKKTNLLPIIPSEEIRNPVVLRALSQSRKVLNAIIKRYGSPSGIYIELAREMGRPFKERDKISKEYNANRTVNEKSRAKIRELYPAISDPRGHDILKYKLWEEQNGRCPYSLSPIEITRLFEPGYAEIDHIIPYSRSFDDSNQNKVLVLGKENQNKQNRTPYEWFGQDEARWQKFISYVSSLKIGRKKKAHLLKMNFDDEQEEAFRSRQLNDTRYITRFFKNFIEENLQFREEKGKKQYVYPVNGAYTFLMRKRWGFNKNRAENDLHHALDAAIVAVSHDNRHKVSAYFKRREVSTSTLLKKVRERFPEPWDGFAKELEARMLQDKERLKIALESLGRHEAYDEQFIEEVKPIFVSRMPKRSVKGQLHEATFRRQRGKNEKGYTIVVTKTELEKISFDKNGDFPMYGKESDQKTYQAIKERYLAYGKDKKKAFAKPLYKPAKNAENAPIIRSVKIEDKRNLFVELNHHTVADNASIARTDVYQHKENGKYYLIPVYVSDLRTGRTPNRLIVAKKPYSEWLELSDEFQFIFSLYQNDLIEVKLPREKEAKNTVGELVVWQNEYFYYRGVDINSASLNLLSHSGHLFDRIGVQRLLTFEKYQVDPLGNIQKVKKENRHGV